MEKNTGVNPREVVSPRSRWQLIDVLHEDGEWSMALGRWLIDDAWTPVLAHRWNGEDGSKGSPVARGYPTWFLLPKETYKLFVDSEFVPVEKKSFVAALLGLE